jgi:hypothetical protein
MYRGSCPERERETSEKGKIVYTHSPEVVAGLLFYEK